MSFGEDDHRDKVPLTYFLSKNLFLITADIQYYFILVSRSAIFITAYQGYILSTWFVTVDVDLDHLAEVVFVRLLHCKVTIPSPLSILFGRKLLSETHI